MLEAENLPEISKIGVWEQVAVLGSVGAKGLVWGDFCAFESLLYPSAWSGSR